MEAQDYRIFAYNKTAIKFRFNYGKGMIEDD